MEEKIIWATSCVYSKGAVIAAHSHKFYHYFYVKKGSGYLKIENKGLKKLRETSKFKANIDSKKFQGVIDQKQKELNRIGSILNKVDADTKLVKIKSTFDQQGKIDVSVGNLNISAKNYWSDNPFELGEMNIAGLMNLVSAYYPKYG